MSHYHEKTLELLGAEGSSKETAHRDRIDWAYVKDTILPAACLEWISLDGECLLKKYSNDDYFGLQKLDIVKVAYREWNTIFRPDWLSLDSEQLLRQYSNDEQVWLGKSTVLTELLGISFHVENQGNFTKIVLLDCGDDPPVFFSWIGRPPWVLYAERFSDCVYAQIFDWQYMLEFDTNDPNYKEITYYGSIDLESDRCLKILRDRFEETVTTRYVMEGKSFSEYRFLKSLQERITVTVGDFKNCAATLCITGKYELVLDLEAELGNLFESKFNLKIVPRSEFDLLE